MEGRGSNNTKVHW